MPAVNRVNQQLDRTTEKRDDALTRIMKRDGERASSIEHTRLTCIHQALTNRNRTTLPTETGTVVTSHVLQQPRPRLLVNIHPTPARRPGPGLPRRGRRGLACYERHQWRVVRQQQERWVARDEPKGFAAVRGRGGAERRGRPGPGWVHGLPGALRVAGAWASEACQIPPRLLIMHMHRPPRSAPS